MDKHYRYILSYVFLLAEYIKRNYLDQNSQRQSQRTTETTTAQMIVLVAERRVQKARHKTNLDIRCCAMLSSQSLLLSFRSNKQQ